GGKRRGAGRAPRQGSGRPGSCRPWLEPLEERTLMSFSTLLSPGPDGHLAYVADAQGNTIPDCSNVGYQQGAVPLPGTNGTPAVPVKAVVQPPAGGADAGAAIQAAIDLVSKLPIDANGFRGAGLLKAGTYPIAGPVHINASGGGLRGRGTGPVGTTLLATGTARRYDPNHPYVDGLVQIEGAIPGGAAWTGGDEFTPVAGSTHNVTDDYVPVGARSFHVDSTAGLKVGD